LRSTTIRVAKCAFKIRDASGKDARPKGEDVRSRHMKVKEEVVTALDS
jgi:hypothetical protein